MARLRQEADQREQAVRDEYSEKLFVEPGQLQEQIDKAVAPLRNQVRQYEERLRKIAEDEKKRVERDRAEREKMAAAGKKKGVGTV
jgi:hypothetical protein